MRDADFTVYNSNQFVVQSESECKSESDSESELESHNDREQDQEVEDQYVPELEKASYAFEFIMKNDKMSGVATSLMAMITWCNLKLLGYEEKKSRYGLNVDEMMNTLRVENSEWKRKAARAVLHWCWWAEQGVFGPLCMCIQKTLAVETYKFNFKSNVGKMVRKYLLKEDLDLDSLGPEMNRFYSLLVKGIVPSVEES